MLLHGQLVEPAWLRLLSRLRFSLFLNFFAIPQVLPSSGAVERVVHDHSKLFRPALLVLLGALLFPLPNRAQLPASSAPSSRHDPSLLRCTLVVRVREQNGSPLSELALVNLYSPMGGLIASTTAEAGQAMFFGVGTGQYTVEAVASGYETIRAQAELDVAGSSVNVDLALTREENPRFKPAASSGLPVLAPKAQKEVGKGLEALRKNRIQEAQKHLQAAHRLAPGNPDVNYLLGVVLAVSGNLAEAQSYWQNALSLYPQHAASLLALGETSAHQGDLSGALAYLKRAAQADPSSWRMKAALASVYLQQQAYEEALLAAEQALELGREKAAAVRILQAKSLAALGQRNRAIAVLETHLAQPGVDAKSTAAAQTLLESLRKPSPPVPAVPAPDRPAKIEATPAASVAALLPVPSEWMPPDIDETVPAVEPGVACPLQDLLQKTGKRIKELLETVDRFTATENLRHEELGSGGLPARMDTRAYNYVVSIREIRPRLLISEEYRNGSVASQDFPGGFATIGVPALVLIFHPYYQQDYEIHCEGLSKWQGLLAWQVHFRQRADKPAEIMSYKAGTLYVTVSLKGRAWISASSSQIIRIELDLVAPMTALQLRTFHIIVDYGPVQFRERKVELWLPKSAELFVDVHGRHLRRHHSYSNFLLFSVEDKQDIKNPQIKEEPAHPAETSSSPPPL